MKTMPLIIAIFMQFVAVFYTDVICTYIIEPMHIAHLSIMWWWLSLPAMLLTFGSIAILIIHGSHEFDITGFWVPKDMHLLDKHKL